MESHTIKRFYKTVTIACDQDACQIYLDKSPLKTQQKKKFQTPTYALAEKIAQEWDAQSDQVNYLSMPHWRLACGAIDYAAQEKETLSNQIAEQVHHDQLCYWAEEKKQPDLYKKQKELFCPVIETFEKKSGHKLELHSGVMPLSHNLEIEKFLKSYFTDFCEFNLIGAKIMADITSSTLLTYSYFENLVEIDQIWQLSQLDETHQAELWGTPEELAQKQDYLKRELMDVHSFLSLITED